MIRAILAVTLLVTAPITTGARALAAPPSGGMAQGEPLDREGERPRRTVAGYPGFRLPDWQIGGTASWTAEGDPPAGNWNTPRPSTTTGPERTGSATGDRGNQAASGADGQGESR